MQEAENQSDGVYKVRSVKRPDGKFGKVIAFPIDAEGEWRRTTEDDGKTVTFKKV